MLLLLLSFMTKVWWFHGETDMTPEAVTADLEAFREDGVGGVVFYDQVHGDGEGAPDAFSPRWWELLRHSAKTAKQLGLTFEMAASNGYVAGGPWITPELAMKKTVITDTLIHLTEPRRVSLPHAGHEVITIAFPDTIASIFLPTDVALTINDTVIPLPSATLRGISYTVTPRGKGSTGSMNVPGAPSERYFGAKYVEYPPIGMLEQSYDSLLWTIVTPLPPVENNIGHKARTRTISFPATTAPYLRLRLYDRPPEAPDYRPVRFSDVTLYTRDITDNIETASGLRTEITYPAVTGCNFGAVNPETIRAVSPGDILPSGSWRVIRLSYVPTGARTKHGRRNLLGYEADVMSKEAVKTHYDNYFRVVLDSLRTAGCAPSGMCMDSHEAGVQNWTAGFERVLASKGTDTRLLAAALAGYIVDTRPATDRLLADFRREIATAIADNFYATLDSLCRADSVDFTAQAMLNICNDNIASRGRVSKPQGEFWAYQTDGNYDVLDAASSAHLYGRPIASAEAFTDTPYETEWDELLRIANLAYCQGINEFVVCASSAQPYFDRPYDDSASAHPYVFHRFHPRRSSVKPFWHYQDRCTRLLREGRPEIDLLVFLGSFLPAKTFAFRLPEIPAGYKFDVVTSDALTGRLSSDGSGGLVTPDSMHYKVLVIPERAEISEQDAARIDALENEGVRVVRPTANHQLSEILPEMFRADLNLPAGKSDISQPIRFFHRSLPGTDIYFVYNHSEEKTELPVDTRSPYPASHIYYPSTDSWEDAGETLTLNPYQSAFIICSEPLNFM